MASGITVHPARLADGRELFYFDDAGSTLGPERSVDRRRLDPRPPTATMRQDVLTGDWISIAESRQNRVFLPSADRDPLAPQSPENPSEVPSRYDVAVFENRSPSFGPELGGPDSGAATAGIGFERTAPSFGRCEVVCFSPETEGSLGTQTVGRVRTVIEAWAERTAALSALPGIRQVFPFENRGEAIGVTLHHPHGQIYAYPIVTPRTQRTLAAVEAAARESVSGDVFAAVLEHELAAGRVVLTGEHWSAFVPFAARWPMEVHLLPHRAVADFAGTTEAERDELAPLYRRLLRAVDAVYDSPTPYIAAWHQAPVGVAGETLRLHLELTSPRRAAERLKYLAGSESAMGAWVGDIPPEQQAESLRRAVDAG